MRGIDLPAGGFLLPFTSATVIAGLWKTAGEAGLVLEGVCIGDWLGMYMTA